MNAIRQKIKRTGDKIIVELPEDFKEETFEIILFPADSMTENNHDEITELNEWRNFSIYNLDRISGEKDSDYSNVLVKEPNEKYNP